MESLHVPALLFYKHTLATDSKPGSDTSSDYLLCSDLKYNRDEEKEHAAMVLEWIRRKDLSFDKELKDYLFTEKPIAHK